jgi:hypothetical protein
MEGLDLGQLTGLDRIGHFGTNCSEVDGPFGTGLVA